LTRGFGAAKDAYLSGWSSWHDSFSARLPEDPLYRRPCTWSASVLRTHEAKHFPGGIIASLSIPWGFSKGDDDLGGYHLVWPRDLVEAAGGFLAVGAHEDALRLLRYLQVTQEGDGHWSQNMWLDGSPYWHGIQMDETALPILLVDLAAQEGASRGGVQSVLADGEGAAGFIVRTVRSAHRIAGKKIQATRRSRWRRRSRRFWRPPISATRAASGRGRVLRETADAWNARIEDWIYVQHTRWLNSAV
jgi:glucoamylase